MKLNVLTIGNPDAATHVVLCHGFGARGDDLADLASVLDPASKSCWHFPEGPVRIPGFDGYAWFPRDPRRLDEALRGNYFSELAQIVEPGLDEAADAVADWIESSSLSGKRLIIGGFSQGAMVALRLGLRGLVSPSGLVNPAGIVMLSGTLIDGKGTLALCKDAPKIPIFQSHGSFDQVLALDGALALKALLENAGFPLRWFQFPGAHEIQMGVLQALGSFLDSLSAGQP